MTLFPSSQVRLFELLKEQAEAQRVQVVFTTHSMTLLEKAVERRGAENNMVKVLYLKKRESGIRLTVDPPIDEIQADLMVEPLRPKKGFKAEIWCEDDEAKWVLKANNAFAIEAEMRHCFREAQLRRVGSSPLGI